MQKEVQSQEQLREEQVQQHRRQLNSKEEEMQRLEESWKQQQGTIKEAGRLEVS